MRRFEGITQIACRVPRGSTRDYRIPKNLAAFLQRTMRKINRTMLFDPSQNRQQLQRRNLGNRAIAKPREDVALKSVENKIRVFAFSLLFCQLAPFARYNFEAVCRPIRGRNLLSLTRLA